VGRQGHSPTHGKKKSAEVTLVEKQRNGVRSIAMQPANLRIKSAGLPVNDYQITDHKLEFRTVDSNGRPFSDQRSTWRPLTASELRLHLRMTVVARWFLEKTTEWDSRAA
jgi:hypothetical protein